MSRWKTVVVGVLALCLVAWLVTAYVLRPGGQRQAANVLSPLRLGASATPHPTPTPLKMVTKQRAAAADFQAGLSLLVYAHEPALAGYAALLDQLVGDDVNSLSIAFPLYTDGLRANAVRAGQDTPTDESLTALARLAKARGFTVMLRPLLDEASILPNWRGEIQPANRTAWFASYGAILMGYARIAQQEGADSLGIGSELNSMEPDVDAWHGLMAQLRQVYSGQLTYSVNWGTTFRTGFWSQLDFLSVDAYFPLDRTPEQATVAQMAADWQRWLDVLRRADQPFGKPIVFTEVGVAPRTGAHLKPWNRMAGTALNLEEQRAYYEATCRAANGTLGGLYWWAAGPELPSNLPPEDYNPLGRPAETAMQACYAQAEGLTAATSPAPR